MTSFKIIHIFEAWWGTTSSKPTAIDFPNVYDAIQYAWGTMAARRGHPKILLDGQYGVVIGSLGTSRFLIIWPGHIWYNRVDERNRTTDNKSKWTQYITSILDTPIRSFVDQTDIPPISTHVSGVELAADLLNML